MKKKLKDTRAKRDRDHVKRRAIGRHGIYLTTKDIASLSLAIQSNKASFVRRISKHLTVWVVKFRSRQLYVYYNTRYHTITTVLPRFCKESLNNREYLTLVEKAAEIRAKHSQQES